MLVMVPAFSSIESHIMDKEKMRAIMLFVKNLCPYPARCCFLMLMLLITYVF